MPFSVTLRKFLKLHKMKKTFVYAMAVAAAMLMVSCGTIGGINTTGTDGSQGLLESVLGTLIGNTVPVTEQSITGTWKYSSPDVRFESENALTQAGGMVVAQQAEAKLAEVYSSIGVTSSSCSFTFGDNKACTIVIGGQKLAGKYTLDSSNNGFSFTSSTGLIKLTGKIFYTGQTLTLLFDGQKLLSLAQTVSTLTGNNNTTISTLSQLLQQYDGMLLGMNLKK